jgi:Flp pilus assembly protein TadG
MAVQEEAHPAVTMHPRLKRLFQRLKADAEKGSAAIEFAMVAPVFFLMLMATIEAGIMFFAQSALQNGLNETARLVRTGQTACFTKTGTTCNPMTQAQFRTQLCTYVSTLLTNCAGSDLQFDVKAYPAGFGGASNTSPLDAGQNLPVLATFDVGKACDVVLARAYYKWPVFTPGLSYLLANMAGGLHLLSSAAAFRNEPFDTNTGGC